MTCLRDHTGRFLSARALLVTWGTLLGATILLASCAGEPSQSEESTMGTFSSTDQGGSEWTWLVLPVIEALPEDGRTKSVHYDREAERLVVTIHHRGNPVGAEELAEIQRRVEEASEGHPYEIILSEEDGPSPE